MNVNSQLMLRTLRPVDRPLGLYFRSGHSDHGALAQHLSELPGSFSGAVVSATRLERQAALLEHLRARNLEAVLDPHATELAMEGSASRPSLQRLPWASTRPHQPDDLAGANGASLIDGVVQAAHESPISAVLAPSHYLGEPGDRWLPVDCDLTTSLRARLDEAGMAKTAVYYPLTLHRRVLVDHRARREIIAQLADLPIDALWLSVHPVGANSSGPVLRSYIEAAADLRQLDLPIVANRAGTAGYAFLAFGAVSGMESGITNGETFDVSRWKRPSEPGSGFQPQPRVYIDRLGLFLSRAQADGFFAARGMKAHFGCADPSCCRNGWESTRQDPVRHFLRSRAAFVGRLSRVTPGARSTVYLEEHLRPASDHILRALKVDPSLERHRKRLEGWRQTLGALHQARGALAAPMAPTGERVVQPNLA